MQISTFTVENEMFALPALVVEEFFRPMPTTKVPGADPRIEGLLNIRGRTAVVIDLRQCLQLPPRPVNQNGEMLLLETASGLVDEARSMNLYAFEEPVVLHVDSVAFIANCDEEDIHPPPPHVKQRFVEGVVETEQFYFTMISIRKLIEDISLVTAGEKR